MRFVLKAVFWFTLVVLVLPKDADQEPGQNIGTAALSERTSEARNRLSAFCRDHPVHCQQTAKALSELDIQTDEGARLALNLLLQTARPSSDPAN